MAFAQLLVFAIGGRDSGEFALLILLVSVVFQAVFYELGYIVHFSFLPEVGKGDDKLVSEISSKYYVLLNTFQVLCIFVAQGANIVFNMVGGKTTNTDSEGEIIPSFDEFDSVVFALAFTVFNCWLFTFLGLRRIEARPAAETLDRPSRNILTAGFKRSFMTIKKIYVTYPQVLVFLGGFMTVMATLSALVSLTTVYLNKQLGISPSLIPFIVLFSVIMSVPGSVLGNKLKHKLPIRRFMILISLAWFVLAASQPLLLRGREKTPEELLVEVVDTTDVNTIITTPYSTPLNCSALGLGGDGEEGEIDIARTYETYELIGAFFASAMTGVLIGLAYPVAAAFYSMIIPGGQEAEFFGVRTFLLKVAAFVPPIIFTTINEGTGRLDMAFGALSPFFAIGAFCFYMVDMEKAQADVLDTLHLRRADDKRIVDAVDTDTQSIRLAKEQEALAIQTPSFKL
jgi:MFS-type transporter involved in bile tolerance (Atg22 family)